MGLDTPGPFRRFEERVFRHREDLIGAHPTLRADGASMMGYGASTKGNVLLQFCGLTRRTFERSRRSMRTNSGASRRGRLFRSSPRARCARGSPTISSSCRGTSATAIVEREEEYLRAADA